MIKPRHYVQKSLLFTIFLMLICVTPFSFADAPASTESILQQARAKRAAGDLSGASILYQQILNKNSNHSIARKELASVLIEAQTLAPEEDMCEATQYILQQMKDNKDGMVKSK